MKNKHIFIRYEIISWLCHVLKRPCKYPFLNHTSSPSTGWFLQGHLQFSSRKLNQYLTNQNLLLSLKAITWLELECKCRLYIIHIYTTAQVQLYVDVIHQIWRNKTINETKITFSAPCACYSILNHLSVLQRMVREVNMFSK